MFGSRKNFAGLAIEDRVIRYLEIGGSLDKLKLVNKVEINLGTDAVRQDAISNVQSLEASLASLKGRLGGKVAGNIALGIPSRDVFLRVVDMPRMGIDDARNAFKWDFEKHIPFSAMDAVFDVAEIDHPQNEDPEMMKMMVAASKSRTVEVLLESLKRTGFNVSSIEPVNIAMFRSIVSPIARFPGGVLSIFVGKDTTQVIVAYLDNGIIYRSIIGGYETDLERFRELLLREASSTLSFVGAQIRMLTIDRVILGGELPDKENFKQLLGEELSLPVEIAEPWDLWGISVNDDKPAGWDSAIGLAVRDLL